MVPFQPFVMERFMSKFEQEVDYNLEDPEFAVALAEKLSSLLEQARA